MGTNCVIKIDNFALKWEGWVSDMPVSMDCIDKHRSGKFLQGEACVEHEICQDTYTENELFQLAAIKDIDGLSEKIIGKARKYAEWLPCISRLAYLLTFTVHEACMNAAEHGILGMNKEVKRLRMEELQERFLDDVDRRWAASGKQVQVSVCINRRSVVVGVHDDGKGFDYNTAHYSPMNEEDILAVSGRGLLILKSLGVRLFWNKQGNTVLCSFHRDDIAKDPPPAST